MYTLEKQANTVSVSVDELIGAGDHYNTASQSFGKRLAQQARELERELGLDIEAEIDPQGFNEAEPFEGISGIERMYQAAGIFGAFDVELLDELEDAEQYLTLDSVSKWERHGVYAIEDAERAARRMVRVNSADYATASGFEYVGDHAQGMGKYTLVPDYHARRVAVRNRAGEAPKTWADLYREARSTHGIALRNKDRQKFERAMKKQAQSPDLKAFLDWAKAQGLAS